MRPLLAVLLLTLPGQDGKLAVPSPADQKKAEADVRSAFKEDFSKKTRDGKKALGQKLLIESADVKNGTVARFVVLQLSRDLAVESVDTLTILAAIERMFGLYDLAKPPLTGASFTSNASALKFAGLVAAQRFATSPEDHQALCEGYLKISEESLRDRLFDDALSAAQAAEKSARSAKASALVERTGVLVKEIPELKKEDETFGTLITSKADDPAARLVKGRYLLFVVGDSKAAIEMLLGCSDEGLKNLAKLESSAPTTADSMMEVAEAWLAIAGKEDSALQKRRYRSQARKWFEEAFKVAGGIAKAKIEKRLKDLEPAGPSNQIDLLKLLDPKDLAAGWKLDAGTLISPGAPPGAAQTSIPFEPPTEYDLRLVVQRKAELTHVTVGLVGGDVPLLLVFDGDHCGIQLDGKGSNVNETTNKVNALAGGQPSSIQITVRRTKFTVTVDGKTMIDWVPNWKRGFFSDYFRVANLKALSVGGCHPAIFTRITLTTVSGAGKRLK